MQLQPRHQSRHPLHELQRLAELLPAAVWFRMPFWQCPFWIAQCKGGRHLLPVLSLRGVLSFGA